MDWTQSIDVIIAHAHYVNATNYTVVGSTVDVRTWMSATVHIDHAPTEDSTANDPGITYEVQVNHADGAEAEYWRTIAVFTASIAASTMETLDDSAASGQKVVPVAATGDLAVGDWVYIRDDGGAAGSEWAQVASISAGVSFTVADNLVNAFTSGEDVFILGVARWVLQIPNLSGISHLRVVNRNADGTGHNWATAAWAVSGTDLQ